MSIPDEDPASSPFKTDHSQTVPADVEAKYITIIDSILAASDLQTISEKRVRKGIQAAVDYDIAPQKVCMSLKAKQNSN